MSNNSRDFGAFEVRVLSESLGKTGNPLQSSTNIDRLNDLSEVVKSQPPVVRPRVRCALLTPGALDVWSVSSLAARPGSYPLTGSVSTRAHKSGLTALKGRGVTQVPS